MKYLAKVAFVQVNPPFNKNEIIDLFALSMDNYPENTKNVIFQSE